MGRIYEKAEQYLDQFDPKCVGQFVEIGTSRQGDDGSTRTMARWAKKFNRHLTTIDIDPDNCEFVKNLGIDDLEIINLAGEGWLSKFPKHMTYISVLYLDNFDWNWHPEKTEDFVSEQIDRYKRFGMEMNNVNSQRAHLRQAELALDALGGHSLVICDDTWYNRWWGHFSGKSGAVVPFLMNHGFEILYTEEQPVYGTILGRGFDKIN